MERANPIEAAYGRIPAANECPPVAATTEGACIAVGANAGQLYAQRAAAGNTGALWRKRGALRALVTFRGATGQLWGFEGKRGLVLHMLATMPQGVTTWETLPWHTRLSASIHVLREAGLSIHTEREGDYRHARYFLRTPGCLIRHRGNTGGDA